MITGMLGKAKGQVLRVAACLQMFFDDSATIEEAAKCGDANRTSPRASNVDKC